MPCHLSKSWFAFVLIVAGFSGRTAAAFWSGDADRAGAFQTVYAWNLADYGDESYRQGVAWVFTSFEKKTGKHLVPGAHKSVGIKIYADSGDGIQTPKGLVRAVVAELRARGFPAEGIFLLDASQANLREAGYLPPLSVREEGDSFEGTAVRSLDSGRWWNRTWFYDNPLPTSLGASTLRRDAEGARERGGEESRRSYLPAPLVEDVDFWINLPVVMDNPSMEVSACLANATLWSVSNRERFFSSPANAPVAMAEIAAIPEFLGNWALSIVSLEKYQVIGGPIFNSNYVRSDPVLLAGADPSVLDSWAARRLNAYRVLMGFQPISNPPYAVSFARMVGVGSSDPNLIEWVMPKDAPVPVILRDPEKVTDPLMSRPRPDSGFFIPPLSLEPGPNQRK